MPKLIRLLTVTALALGSLAADANNEMWSCSLQTIMTGNGRYFLLYGRDSWRGTGTMQCRDSQGSQSVPVELVFQSLVGAVGANDSSSLFVSAALWTLTAPVNLRARTVITSAAADPYFHWSISSELTTVHATVWSPLTPTLRASLSRGTLFLRTAVNGGL